MNNAFGHIPENLLQQAHDAWEFKTCQRSDGTTYGTAGDCAQKGSKEVKKSSKKSSWDDSNLAGKMGREVSKVAGPAMTPGEAKGKRYIEELNSLNEKTDVAIQRVQSGQISGKQFGAQIAADRKKAFGLLRKIMLNANAMVDSGEATPAYAKRVRKDIKPMEDQYSNFFRMVVEDGLAPNSKAPSIPAPSSGRPSKPKTSSGGGSKRQNNNTAAQNQSNMAALMQGQALQHRINQLEAQGLDASKERRQMHSIYANAGGDLGEGYNTMMNAIPGLGDLLKQ